MQFSHSTLVCLVLEMSKLSKNASVRCCTFIFIMDPKCFIVGLKCFRRVEDKLDSRSMLNYLISVRMECPPATKRVPLQMMGWIVMMETGAEDNIFKTSPLFVDRPGILTPPSVLIPKLG